MGTLNRAPLLAIVLTLAATALPSRKAATSAPNVQIINVTAKKYEFDPSPIHVKQGTKVELRITAIDHRHGFSIQLTPVGSSKNAAPGLLFDSPRKCWNLPKGKTTIIEFVAKTRGTYPFHCCHFCGFGHKRMKGELIVGP